MGAVSDPRPHRRTGGAVARNRRGRRGGFAVTPVRHTRSRRLVVMACLAVVLCAACTPAAPGVAPDPASASGPPDAVRVVTTHLQRSDPAPGGGRCDYDLTWAQVQGLEPRVAAAVNAALDLTPGPAECTSPGASVTGGYRAVALDAHGVLSLAYTTLTTVPGAAYPSSERTAVTLDLRTGDPIRLDDLLTDVGRRLFVQRCVDGLARRAPDGIDPQYCATALDEPTPQFTITPGGLVAQPYNEVPHVSQALAEDGVLVTWTEIGDGLRAGTVVAPLAGR